MPKTIVGIFEDSTTADNATNIIKQQNLNSNDISIITNKPHNRNSNSPIADKGLINDNISDGTITGTVIGGTTGLLVGIGSVAIPGLGVIAAAGPIVGLISGSITGGLIGGLIDLGIDEDSSKKYESDINQGKTFLSVPCEDQNVEKVSTILRNSGASSVETH